MKHESKEKINYICLNIAHKKKNRSSGTSPTYYIVIFNRFNYFILLTKCLHQQCSESQYRRMLFNTAAKQ